MEIAKDSKRNKEIQIILIILSAQVEHNTQEGFQQFFITFSPRTLLHLQLLLPSWTLPLPAQGPLNGLFL